MSYPPSDTYAPSARGGAQVPQLVGQRVEAARAYAASAGWVVQVNDVPPATAAQPDGFVLRQVPAAGSVLPAGAVLLIDVGRRPSFAEQYGRGALAGAAVALAIVALVFALLWAGARSDDAGSDELDLANARIAELEAQVEAAAGDAGELVATLQEQLAAANARLAELDAQVVELTTQVEQSSAANQALTTERDALVTERDTLTQRVAELEAELGGITGSVVATPDWNGQQLATVEAFVEAEELELVVDTVDGAETESGDPLPDGTVVLQLPAAGTPLVAGSVVVVTVVATTP